MPISYFNGHCLNWKLSINDIHIDDKFYDKLVPYFDLMKFIKVANDFWLEFSQPTLLDKLVFNLYFNTKNSVERAIRKYFDVDGVLLNDESNQLLIIKRVNIISSVDIRDLFELLVKNSIYIEQLDIPKDPIQQLNLQNSQAICKINNLRLKLNKDCKIESELLDKISKINPNVLCIHPDEYTSQISFDFFKILFYLSEKCKLKLCFAKAPKVVKFEFSWIYLTIRLNKETNPYLAFWKSFLITVDSQNAYMLK